MEVGRDGVGIADRFLEEVMRDQKVSKQWMGRARTSTWKYEGGDGQVRTGSRMDKKGELVRYQARESWGTKIMTGKYEQVLE